MRTTCLQDDDSFDRLLPEWSCRVSRGNWTPLAVARRAAELLVAEPGTYVLDVGSGVGKLCMVGALTTRGHFHGVEQRPHFVAAARAVAARLELRHVGFTVGHVTAVNWRQFDSFYLFNPFAEYFDTLLEPFDDRPAIDRPRHAAYVSQVREQLALLVNGTRVVTYAGFGGDFPDSYRLELSEPAGSDALQLWIKVS